MQKRVSGMPPSGNGASSLHLIWETSTRNVEAVRATLEITRPPASPDLYFFALQATFTGAAGDEGGAHVGLQWNLRHPGSTAVNWGGYRSQHHGGTILPGTESRLPSRPSDPNTRDYPWKPHRPYRLAIEPGYVPGWWLGSVTDLITGEATPIRELDGGGRALRAPTDAAKPPKTKFVKYAPKPGDKIALNTQPRDMQFWELVNTYVQREPMADRDRFFYAWLKDLGIEKGKPFKPTDYQKEILQAGLDVGMAMSQAISFNKTREMFPTSLYGKDSGFEDAMAGMNPKIDLETYSMFNERASYGFEATTTSAGMVSRVPGKGSAYLGELLRLGWQCIDGW